MNNLNYRQRSQEEQYLFPYHYSDLFCTEDRLLWEVDRRSLLTQVKNIILAFEGRKILDAGCGDGRLCYELCKEKVKVIGVDYSQRAIKFAKAFNPKTKFYVDSLESFTIPIKFNQIILMETLEHIDPNNIDLVINNLKKHLTNRGRLIITVPSILTPLKNYPKHYQHFTQNSLKNVLALHFKSISIRGYASCSFRRKLFHIFRLVAYAFYPFRNQISPVTHFYKFIQSFYNSQIAIGNPDSCLGLIAICQSPILRPKT